MASHSDPAGGGVDWESRYQAGDTPWDKGSAHPGLVDWLKTNALTGRVLVPGCGAGHDVRAISKNSAALVTGLDIAPSALAAARAFPTVGAETYRLGNFLAGDAGPGWDAIFEHTCFCAIDPSERPAYARAAAQSLKPGGLFLAIFYRNPDHEGGPPFGCSMDEIDDLFGSHFETRESREGFRTFDGRENREVLRLMLRK